MTGTRPGRRPAFDPESLPVLRADTHLPAPARSRYVASALRRRFLEPPTWSPETHSERRIVEREPAAAAVLIALVQRHEPTVLFTRRTDHLSDHPGQISFPGGRSEAVDADAIATALREAHEEIGLEPAAVEVLGSLPIYSTGTGFIVTPVVGLVPPDVALRPDPVEVAEVFEVPLAWLMDPAHHQHHAVEIAGASREFISIPWQKSGEGPAPRRYFIWGATAAMLRNLYRFLIA